MSNNKPDTPHWGFLSVYIEEMNSPFVDLAALRLGLFFHLAPCSSFASPPKKTRATTHDMDGCHHHHHPTLINLTRSLFPLHSSSAHPEYYLPPSSSFTPLPYFPPLLPYSIHHNEAYRGDDLPYQPINSKTLNRSKSRRRPPLDGRSATALTPSPTTKGPYTPCGILWGYLHWYHIPHIPITGNGLVQRVVRSLDGLPWRN